MVLYLHGNAGNAYDRLDHAQAISELGCNVLLLSYRGYGKSTGSPTEDGVYLDAEAALFHLRNRGFSPADTFVFGRSLGSAVAVHTAQHRVLAGMILVSPFTSARDMARARGLSGLLLSNSSPFDSARKISRVSCPLLVIHGDQDQIVPVELGLALFESYAGPKRLVVVSGAAHNDVASVAGPSYWQSIGAFLIDPLSASR